MKYRDLLEQSIPDPTPYFNERVDYSSQNNSKVLNVDSTNIREFSIDNIYNTKIIQKATQVDSSEIGQSYDITTDFQTIINNDITSLKFDENIERIHADSLTNFQNLQQFNLPKNCTYFDLKAVQNSTKLKTIIAHNKNSGLVNKYFNISYIQNIENSSMDSHIDSYITTLIVNTDVGVNSNLIQTSLTDEQLQSSSLDLSMTTGHQRIEQSNIYPMDNSSAETLGIGAKLLQRTGNSSSILSQIDIPNVKTIFESGLRNNTALTSIAAYDVEEIREAGCQNVGIQSLDLNNSYIHLTKIGNKGFANCLNLSRVYGNYAKNVEYGESAFANNSNLEYCDITTDYLHKDLLYNCTGLTFFFANRMSEIEKINTGDKSQNLKHFSLNCGNVTNIHEGAFSGFKNINGDFDKNELYFEDQETLKIGSKAFYDCNFISSITLKKYTNFICEPSAFANMPELEKLWLINGLTAYPEAIFMDCTKLSSISDNYSQNTTSIGASALMNCSDLSVSIYSKVVTLGPKAFYNTKRIPSQFKNLTLMYDDSLASKSTSNNSLELSYLESVLGDNNTVLLPEGINSFYLNLKTDMTKLWGSYPINFVQLKGYSTDGVFSVGNLLPLFGSEVSIVCSKSITFKPNISYDTPAEVKRISILEAVDIDCDIIRLKNLEYLWAPFATRIGDRLFCEDDSTLNTPKLEIDMQMCSVLGKSVFYANNRITKLRIKQPITELGNYAFYQVTNISIPSTLFNLTKIDYGTFRDTDTNFTAIKNLDKVVYLGSNAFRDNTAFAGNGYGYVDLKSVTYMGETIFSNCYSIRTVNLNPDSRYGMIGWFQYYNCTNLQMFKCDGDKPHITAGFSYRGSYNCTNISKFENVRFKNTGNIPKCKISELSVQNESDSIFTLQGLSGLTALTKVNFYGNYPNGIKINNYCFSSTNPSILLQWDLIKEINNNAFQGCSLPKYLELNNCTINEYGLDMSNTATLVLNKASGNVIKNDNTSFECIYYINPQNGGDMEFPSSVKTIIWDTPNKNCLPNCAGHSINPTMRWDTKTNLEMVVFPRFNINGSDYSSTTIGYIGFTPAPYCVWPSASDNKIRDGVTVVGDFNFKMFTLNNWQMTYGLTYLCTGPWDTPPENQNRLFDNCKIDYPFLDYDVSSGVPTVSYPTEEYSYSNRVQYPNYNDPTYTITWTVMRPYLWQCDSVKHASTDDYSFTNYMNFNTTRMCIYFKPDVNYYDVNTSMLNPFIKRYNILHSTRIFNNCSELFLLNIKPEYGGSPTLQVRAPNLQTLICYNCDIVNIINVNESGTTTDSIAKTLKLYVGPKTLWTNLINGLNRGLREGTVVVFTDEDYQY